MIVATFNQNNFTTQDPTTYKTALDGNIAVFKRIGDDFAPHAQATPNMTVALDAGHIFNGSTLTEVAAQSTGTVTGPVTYSRIDRVVIDALAGTIAVITGTEAASPTPPAITIGTLPVAQILLAVGVTAITNSMLTDERDLTRKGMTSGAQATITAATTTGIVAAKSTNLILTGSTTITSFGASGTTGTIYRCRLTGTPLITYNATNLITPGSANIQGAAGDTFDVEDLGSNNFRIREYYPASGAGFKAFTGDTGSGGVAGLVPAPTAGQGTAKQLLRADGVFINQGQRRVSVTNLASGTPSVTLSGFNSGSNYIIRLSNIYGSAAASIYGQLSTDGVTFISSTNAYFNAQFAFSNSATGTSGGGSTVLLLGSMSTSSGSSGSFSGTVMLDDAANASFPTTLTVSGILNPTAYRISGQRAANEADIAMKIYPASGTFSGGTIELWEMAPG